MPKTLLLADDSVTIQKVVGITFANEDVELITVDNGDDALVRAREAKPDLVLADVAMPGLSGYELCGAIKRDRDLSGIPVLLLTGTFESYDPERATEVGADAHISKPFEAQALIDQVNTLLEAAVSRAPAVAQAPAEVAGAVPLPAESTRETGGEVVVPAPAEGALPREEIAFTPADFDMSPPTGDQTTVLDEAALRAMERAPVPEPRHPEPPAVPDQVESAVAAEIASLGDDTSGTTSGFLDPLAVGEAEDSLSEQTESTTPAAPEAFAPAASSFVDPLEDSGGRDFGAMADADAQLLEDSFSDLPPALAAEPRPSWNVEPPTGAGLDVDPLGDTAQAEATHPDPDPGAEADAGDLDDEDLPWVEPLPLEDEFEDEPRAPEPEVTARPDETALAAPFAAVEPAHFEAPAAEPEPLPDPEPPALEPEPEPEAPAAPAAAPRRAPVLDGRALSESVEKVAWEAFGNLSEQIVRDVMRKVEEVCWEVIPQLAERIIREEIDRLKADDES